MSRHSRFLVIVQTGALAVESSYLLGQTLSQLHGTAKPAAPRSLLDVVGRAARIDEEFIPKDVEGGARQFLAYAYENAEEPVWCELWREVEGLESW